MSSEHITIPEALGISVLGFAIVFVVLAVLILVVKIISKASGNGRKKAAAPAVSAPVSSPVSAAPPAPGSAGGCDLHGVDERTAAMLMAIVADQIGAPLNELRFRSIKEIK